MPTGCLPDFQRAGGAWLHNDSVFLSLCPRHDLKPDEVGADAASG